MFTKRIVGAAVALFLAVPACTDDKGTGPVTGDLITLTAAQAAALVSRVEAFGTTDPTLASLSDTVDVVIKAGAEARRIDVTTDLGSGPFWAVSLHRATTLSSPASSTFDVIAFNDPNNPTQFMILGGWASGSGANPPNSVTGSLSGPTGTTSVTAHLLSVSGSVVSAWHSTAGTSALTAHSTGQLCSGFTGPGGCERSLMDITFNISGTLADNNTPATGQRTASGTVTGVPGIKLSN